MCKIISESRLSVSKFGGYLISLQKYLKEIVAVEFQYLVKEIGSLCKEARYASSQCSVVMLCLQIFESVSCIYFQFSESPNLRWEHSKEIIKKQPVKSELAQSFKKHLFFDIVL